MHACMHTVHVQSKYTQKRNTLQGCFMTTAHSKATFTQNKRLIIYNPNNMGFMIEGPEKIPRKGFVLMGQTPVLCQC